MTAKACAKGGYHRSHAEENPYQIRTDLILCTYEIRRFFEGGQKNDGILSRGGLLLSPSAMVDRWRRLCTGGIFTETLLPAISLEDFKFVFKI